MSATVVTFLSDYGYSDEFVGVCHGVIAARCPQARIIDVTHGIAFGDVRAGALALQAALPFMPPGVHLAVVDPGVGGERRAIALETTEQRRVLVGPDNGLLLPAAAAFGGAARAYDIGDSSEAYPLGRTFDGRDVFAPVAAAIADGALPASLGREIAADGLVALALPQAATQGDWLLVPVLSIDGYGNVALASRERPPGSSVVIELAGARHEVALGDRFGDVAPGELVAYIDSRRALALAVNGGSAAERLGLAVDDPVRILIR